MLATVLALSAGGLDASAASSLGLYVSTGKPTLALDFGNPTDYSALKPGPVSLDLGAIGTYFHGHESESLSETYSGSGSPYGGPGDSWSSLSLTSPTPGSISDTPITIRFDSRIANFNSSVGYFVGSGTGDFLYWYFNQPATNIHFRVEWSINYVGEPYTVRSCQFIPPASFVCSNVTVLSSGRLNVVLGIEGHGSQTIYGSGGSATAIGPGNQRYSGTVAGVANNSRLGFSFGASFYEGQATRGDGRVIVEFRIYADTESLSPVVPPTLALTPLPDRTLHASWPASASGFVLQEKADLNNTNWTPVAQSPVVVGTNKVVILNPPVGSRFFRLFKP